MGVSARDLDDWADALNVNNDDDAKTQVVRLMTKAALAGEAARLLARLLVDMPAGEHAKHAASATDEAFDALGRVADGFNRHERGMR